MTESRKFVYVTKHFIGKNAPTSQIRSQIQAFHNIHKDHFSFIYNNGSSNLIPDNIYSFQYSGSKLFFYVRVLALFFTNREWVIYTRDILIAFFASVLKMKHAYEVHKPPSLHAKFLMKFLSTRSLFVCISDNLRKYLKSRFQIQGSKVLVAHDGVDINSYNILHEHKEDIKHSLKLPKDKLNFVYTGSFGIGRDYEAFHQAIKLNPNAQFYLAGTTESAYLDLLKLKELPSNLVILGYLPKEKIRLFQISADFLLNLLDESHPNFKYCSQLKIFEYFATKNITISPDIGSLSEIINDSNAIIYHQDLPQQIQQILKDQSYDSKLSQNAYKLASQFTWENRANKILTFLNSN